MKMGAALLYRLAVHINDLLGGEQRVVSLRDLKDEVKFGEFQARLRRIAVGFLFVDEAADLSEIEQELLNRDAGRPVVVRAERLRKVAVGQVVVLSGDSREHAFVEKGRVADAVGGRSQVLADAIGLGEKVRSSLAHARPRHPDFGFRLKPAWMQSEGDFGGLLEGEFGIGRDWVFGGAGPYARAAPQGGRGDRRGRGMQ